MARTPDTRAPDTGDAAEFDRSRRPPATQTKLDPKNFTDGGRDDLKNRRHGNPRYADNALQDTARLDEFEDSSLDRLHDMLRAAGVSDDEIKADIRLSPNGYQKVAAALGIAPGEVELLLNSLTEHLRDSNDSQMLVNAYEAAMAGDRFAAEPDSLSNLTIRDKRTGKETFVRGSEASDLTRRLRRGEDPQKLLARYSSVMEDADEEDPTLPDEDLMAEIESDAPGTYNFEWRIDGTTGSGTAKYWLQGDEPKIALVQARDGEGNEIHPDAEMTRKLMRAARDFAGKV